MTALHLRNAIDKFFDQISEADNFIDGLALISRHGDTLDSPIEHIAAGGNRLNEGANSLHNAFASLSRSTANINNRSFFKSLEKFQTGLEDLQKIWIGECEPFKQLRGEIEKFAALYDQYLSAQNGTRARPLIFLAQRLHAELQIFVALLAAIRTSSIPEEVRSSSDSQIFILLPERMSLKDFAERLIVLQTIYSEICALFQVSEVDHPLRIGKIESGSLWALLFGNTKVVETMASFIERSALWSYRNYTTEGKISNLPRKVEAIDAILGLSDRLEKSGIDTSQMKPNIEKAAISLSKDLSVLLDGQSSITVNEENLSLQAEFTKSLIERRETKLLGVRSNNASVSSEDSIRSRIE